MSDRQDLPGGASAAGPHRPDWADLGRETKAEFNDRARGSTREAESAGALGDKANHVLDREPSIAEKNRGEDYDRSNTAKSDYAARKDRFRARDNDLGMGRS